MGQKDVRTESAGCPICADAGAAKFFASENNYRIVRCTSCGLLYVNPRPEAEFTHNLFDKDYFDAKTAEKNLSQRKNTLARYARIIQDIYPQGGRLLDIGAATGSFLNCFQAKRNWNAEGVEPSTAAVKYAREKFGLAIHHGTLEGCAFPNEAFDVATMLDSLQYVPDPNAHIAAVRRILKPGGMFILDIAGLNLYLFRNTGIVSRMLFGVRSQLSAGTRLYYYSGKTLRQLMENNGFALVRSHPEQFSETGTPFQRMIRTLYSAFSTSLYRLTGGKLSIVPYELFVFRKV